MDFCPNCPRCGTKMNKEERLCIQRGPDGNKMAKQMVWYCRDCMCSMTIRK